MGTGGAVEALRAESETMKHLRNTLAAFAVVGIVFYPLFFAIAALGARFHLWSYRFALGLLVQKVGIPLLLAGIVIGLLALASTFFVSPRRGVIVSLIGAIVPALGLGYGLHIRTTAQKLPAIHDVSTDWREPLKFSAETLKARGPQSNPVSLDGRLPGDYPVESLRNRPYETLIAASYPDIMPVIVGGRRDEAFGKVLAAARKMGWRVTHADRAAGRIEATATSFWFGFTDDIVVRLSDRELTQKVDIRSVSRVGVSDIGANARRIIAFEKVLRAL